MRLADPTPGFCSVCFAANPDRRFIDCEAAYDGAPVLDRETRSIAVLPWNGLLGGHDDLFICEPCVQEACELLGLRAGLHERQLAEIHRLGRDLSELREYVASLEATLGRRPEMVGV